MNVLFKNARFPSAETRTDYDPPLPVTLDPRTLEYTAIGGPSRATINASGAINTLMALANKLGRYVLITDERGDEVWWGVVWEVSVSDGQAAHTFSYENMTNSAAIVYYKVSSGADGVGARTMSEWVDDAESVAKYGRVKTLLSGTRMTESEAAQRIASVLKESANPYAGSEIQQGDAQAVVTCVGIWDLLATEYYADSTRIHSYEPQPNYQQLLGEGSGLGKIAMRFSAPDGTGGFDGKDLTIRAAKWIDPATKLPDNSVFHNSEESGATYRLRCEIYSDSLGYVADCHHGRDTQYSYPGAQHQDAGAADERIFITIPGGWSDDYGRGGSHKTGVSPKWFAVGDKIRLAFVVGGAVTYGDLATITAVDTVAVGYYSISRGSGALPYSNRVFASLPGNFICRSDIEAKSIPQTNPAPITFKDFRDADGLPKSFPVSTLQATWIVLFRTDPPTGAHGEYVGKGYYIIDGSTEMSYAAPDKPGLAGTFTLRGAGLVYDAPNDVWRHCIPARDNTGGAQIWFKVSGETQTTDQIKSMGGASQWLRSVIVISQSGKTSVPYRNGERTLQDEIIALLRQGDEDGTPYTACVDSRQRLIVQPKDDGTFLDTSTTQPFRLPAPPIVRRRDGSLQLPGGKPLPLLPPPIGKFVRLEGAIDAPPFYVETAVWDAATGKLDLRSPTKGGAFFDVASIEEG